MLRRINQALPALIVGIIAFGAAVQLSGVWFVSDKLRYSIGLWMGIATACGMAVHMAVILYDVMDLTEKGARSRVTLQYMLRYAVVAVVFFLTAYFKLGNPVTFFIGVMGLKAGAYLQPLTHKIISKLTGENDESCEESGCE